MGVRCIFIATITLYFEISTIFLKYTHAENRDENLYSLSSFRRKMKDERKRFFDEIENITTSEIKTKPLKTKSPDLDGVVAEDERKRSDVESSKEQIIVREKESIDTSEQKEIDTEEYIQGSRANYTLEARVEVEEPEGDEAKEEIWNGDGEAVMAKDNVTEIDLENDNQGLTIQAKSDENSNMTKDENISKVHLEIESQGISSLSVDKKETRECNVTEAEAEITPDSTDALLQDPPDFQTTIPEPPTSEDIATEVDEGNSEPIQVEVQIHVNPSPDFVLDGNTFEFNTKSLLDGILQEADIVEQEEDILASDDDVIEIFEPVTLKQIFKSQKREETMPKKETMKRLKKVRNQLMDRPFNSFDDFENEQRQKDALSLFADLGSKYFILTTISVAAWTYTSINELRTWLAVTKAQQVALATFTGGVALSLCSCRSLLLDLPSVPQERVSQITKPEVRAGLLVVLSACGLLGMLASLSYLAQGNLLSVAPLSVPQGLRVLVPLAIALPLALSYDQPIVPYKGQRVAWRCLPVARLAMGVLQAALSVGCPVFLGWRPELSGEDAAVGIVRCICFGTAVAASVNTGLVIGDIQTVNKDRAQGKLTVPVVFGSAAAKSLALFLIFQSVGLFFAAGTSTSLWSLNSLLGVFLIFGYREKYDSLWTLLLKTQGIMALVFSQFAQNDSNETWWHHAQRLWCKVNGKIFRAVEKSKKKIQKGHGWTFKVHFS